MIAYDRIHLFTLARAQDLNILQVFSEDRKYFTKIIRLIRLGKDEFQMLQKKKDIYT